MRSLIYLATMLLLPGWAAAQDTQTQVYPDSADVVQAVDDFHEALAVRDSNAVDAMLLSDAVILESGGVETKEEYFSHYFGADADFLENMERGIEQRHVRLEGETAWVSTVSRLSGTHNGESLDINSAELIVLRQTPDEWRIAAIHWSSRPRD